MTHPVGRTRPSSGRGSSGTMLCRVAAVGIALAALAQPAGAQVVFTGSGLSPAAIQPSVDAFRASLGPLNANVAGSFGSGRREINWDGVNDANSAPNAFPSNFFNVNSPRGVVFATPGTGFQLSATVASGTPVLFGNLDPSYATSFTTFSAQRLFTSIGSNVLDVNFFVPGALTPALTRGFGAVFTDVDLANVSSLQFFDAANASLGTFFVAPGGASTAGPSLSFLGVDFLTSIVSRVRITAGNTSLAAGLSDQNGNPRDAVATDDFIYGEPVTTVPEPTTFVLLAFALGLLALGARRTGRA